MATLNALIVPAKVLKGGRHKVRISVAHNGETRYIVTDIIIDSNKEFKNGQVVKRADAASMNTKLRGLMQRYQQTIDELEYTNGLTCPELVYLIKNAHNYKHRTISSIYKEFVNYSKIKKSTEMFYNAQFMSLVSFTGENMLIEKVSHATVIGYDKFLRSKNYAPCTIRNKMVFLMLLVGYAKRCQYADYKIDPFMGYELPEQTVRQAWLSVDEVRMIRDFQTPKKSLQKCRDMFMLSYYLGGINMCDLININFDEQTDKIHYVRSKTENRRKLNKFVEFVIPDEAKAIIARYKSSNGRIALNNFQQVYKMQHFFSYNMPLLAKALGLERLIYYSARKSFSQHAFMLGISTSVIDYILGHRVDKTSTSLYNYISVTPELASSALRKVLDQLAEK